MRSAVNQANQAFGQATNTANSLGGAASSIGGNLTPFLTQRMLHPEGYSQQDQSAMLAAAQGGAGGESAGIGGAANKQAAVTHNAGGFQAALDDAARQRMKGAAGGAEGIAADNANLKQSQSDEASKQLQGLYGTDTSGMLNAMGQESGDINTGVNASNSGWLQNTMGVLQDIGGLASGAGAMGMKFGKH
jgi:hypothetical protein